MSFFYNATGDMIELNNSIENFTNVNDSDYENFGNSNVESPFISYSDSIESFSNEKQSDTPVNPLTDTAKSTETASPKSSDVKPLTDTAKSNDTASPKSSDVKPLKKATKKEIKIMPKEKDQDFLALDGNLVLDGTVKATNFIKTDGSVVKEVPILKNNYVIPKSIKYNADGTVTVEKLNSKDISSDSLKVKNMITSEMVESETISAKSMSADSVKVKNQLDAKQIYTSGAVNVGSVQSRGGLEIKNGTATIRRGDKNLVLNIQGKGGMQVGPSRWGKQLVLGGSDHKANRKSAHIHTTNGNLHLDPAPGGRATYINHYQRNGSVLLFGNTTAYKDLTVNGYIKNAMPDTRNANMTPVQYRRRIGKGRVQEFKIAKKIGVNFKGYGVLTTTVPWPDKSGGNVYQDFEQSYNGKRYKAQRNEINNNRWSPWQVVQNGDTMIAKNINARNITGDVVRGKSRVEHRRADGQWSIALERSNEINCYEHTGGKFNNKKASRLYIQYRNAGGKKGALHLGYNDAKVTIDRVPHGGSDTRIKPLRLYGAKPYYSGYKAPGYYKKDGIVYLTGLIRPTGSRYGMTIAKLPGGYRPNGNLIFDVRTGEANRNYGSSQRINIYSNGIINRQYSRINSAWVSLDGISFKAEK